MTRLNIGNKFKAKRTYSQLCGRTFDSKAEAKRGEELFLLQKAGKLHGLDYQVKFTLSEKPKVTIKIDFAYHAGEDESLWTDAEIDGFVYEDVKGVLTRDFRTKLAWLRQLKDIEVKLVRAGG